MSKDTSIVEQLNHFKRNLGHSPDEYKEKGKTIKEICIGT